jgi:hypothetical protein
MHTNLFRLRLLARLRFAVTGDDVAIDPSNLVHLLSAFDPDEDWCLADAGVQHKGGAKQTISIEVYLLL